MSETTTTLLNRFLALPRAIQWALLAAIGMMLFFAWDAVVGPMIEDFDRKSRVISEQVRKIHAAKALVDDLKTNEFSRIVAGVGAVQKPRSPAVGTGSFTTVVNELMKQHAISDQDFSLRTRGKLPKNALVGVLDAGKRAERLTGDLKFSARPEVAVEILAALESSPDIEQVSSVRLTKDQNGKVKVQLTLEAWVSATETGSGSMGTSL